MDNTPQLFMRKASLTDLPELSRQIGELPLGISLHTLAEGQEKNWEELIERCFGHFFDFGKNMKSFKGYHPSHVLYLSKNGVDVAVSAAVEEKRFPGEGWLHFVGVIPEARGMKLSAHIVLAALYSFYAQGYESVVLSTDDFRLFAIKTYLKLGFEPLIIHQSHQERWNIIFQQLM